MTRLRILFFTLVCSLSVACAFGQAWMSAYDAGIRAAKGAQWSDARTSFLKAAAYRPEDASAPTLLPGPVTERRTWRSGAPYSPNFLAAYAAYKSAGAMGVGDEQTSLYKLAASELEERLAKGQQSRATYYLLTTIYTKLNDIPKRDATVNAYNGAAAKATWRIDTDGISPEDLANMNAAGPGNPVATAGQPGTGTSGPVVTVRPDAHGLVPLTSSLSSVVTSVPTKYALIVGNSETKMPGAGAGYASDDAQLMRSALVANAGYIDGNIDLVLNATAEQMMTSARALASRMPNGGSVLIFFSGRGVNIAGKDYLAGVDTSSAADSGSMVAKADLFDLFLRKDTQVFSFFEVSREVQDGRFFGMEYPISGAIAQMYATAQGTPLTSIYRDSKLTGVFVDAFVNVLQDLKSNGIPILEFGWQVFGKMRHGSTGSSGGGSQQTPTLPVLSHMGSDAKF